jgi:hypothetical protein
MLLEIDKWLLRLAGFLLLLVGVIKLISAFSGVAYLREFDPVLTFLHNEQVLIIIGNIELALAVLLLMSPNVLEVRLGLLALCATFVIYRISRLVLHVTTPCPCLGRASDWLHITPSHALALANCLLFIFGTIGVISVAIYPKVTTKSLSRDCNLVC